jgi:hypothetical protein
MPLWRLIWRLDTLAMLRGAAHISGIFLEMDSAQAPRASAPKWQAAALWIGIAGLFVLRIIYALTFKVNSDEPQHLHVVWSWTQGLVQYRDFFDNHAPLFYLLYSPLLALIGERADIIPLMRLGMLPLYFAGLWITWSIGRRLWSPPVALAGTALAALFPSYFELSVQFRTDNLWALMWLATILVLVSGRLDLRRGFFAGLLVGATFAVSLKSVLLAGTAIASALIVFAMLGWQDRRRRERLPSQAIGGFALGVVVIPAALLAWFAAQGAWQPMMYCLFKHNIVPGLGRWADGIAHFFIAPLTLPIALWLAWRSRSSDQAVWARRVFLLLAAFGYLAALYGYWPLFTRQDLLPVIPFVGLGFAALLSMLALRARGVPAIALRWAVPALIVAELASLMSGNPGSKNITIEAHREKLESILSLTKPGEFVMDAKGESIFRKRPIYWVLEGITLERMRKGSIVDDIPEKLAETGTAVVVIDRLPQRALDFVQRNYLPAMLNLSVAGQRFAGSAADTPVRFTVEIEAEYAIVGPDGALQGELDGSMYAGPRRLGRGEHEFRSQRPGTFALVWAPALERGLTTAALFAQVSQ